MHRRMRNHIWILCSLALGLAACEQSHYCADVAPNATVTDVIHDENEQRLIVGLYHSLSYCTGTDEKRFSNERIEVDLATGAAIVDQQASNARGPLALPEIGYFLYRDGQFGNTPCGGCELVLRSHDGIYTFHFTMLEDFEPVMTLEVLEEEAPLAVVDIGGYTSEPRPSR
jgi:hypothetical protein